MQKRIVDQDDSKTEDGCDIRNGDGKEENSTSLDW